MRRVEVGNGRGIRGEEERTRRRRLNRGWLKRDEGVNNKGMGGRKGGKESTREEKERLTREYRRGEERRGGGGQEGGRKKRKSRGRRNLNV